MPAHKILSKYIFHVDNVQSDLSCDDVCSFLADNNIQSISCFEAKSWMKSNAANAELTDDINNVCKSVKAFRVCVKEQYKP